MASKRKNNDSSKLEDTKPSKDVMEEEEDEKKNANSLRTFVVAGSYEHTVFGLELQSADSNTPKRKRVSDTESTTTKAEEVNLDLQFMDASHDGCIKAVASYANVLVSSGTDDTVRIYDLLKKTQTGTLLSSDSESGGHITHLLFLNKGNHLLGANDKGRITIWRTNDWLVLTTLKGHKDSINSMDLHSTGKIAYSVSKDKTFKMWNLLKGKCAFSTTLEVPGEMIKISPDDQVFVILARNVMAVYSAVDGEKKRSLKSKMKTNAILFVEDNLLASAGEGETIEIWDVTKAECVAQVVTKSKRIKSLIRVGNGFMGSISSEGLIQIWDIREPKNISLLTQHDTTARLTCVTSSTV